MQLQEPKAQALSTPARVRRRTIRLFGEARPLRFSARGWQAAMWRRQTGTLVAEKEEGDRYMDGRIGEGRESSLTWSITVASWSGGVQLAESTASSIRFVGVRLRRKMR